jgi:hypothetical protein
LIGIGNGDAPGLNAVIRGVVRSAIYAIASWARAWALPLPTWLPTDNLAVWSASRLVKWHQYPLTRHSKKMKFIDLSSEIVHAARCVGITFGDSA